MKDVWIDEYGEQRCWSCSGNDFTAKRPMRSILLLGGLALLTKKKLKCLNCGEFNEVPSNNVL
ncbi:MAG: hypothetical protein VYA88_01010 [Actinomycetota bacterium]|nr:hypothetical protein [Actinomycetota bacterium]